MLTLKSAFNIRTNMVITLLKPLDVYTMHISFITIQHDIKYFSELASFEISKNTVLHPKNDLY